MSANIDTRSTIEHSGDSKVENPISPCLQKRFLTHFKLYSLVNSTRDIIFMIPLARQCATNIAPTFQVIRNTNPIKAVMDKGDPIADGALKKLDSVAPGLRKCDYDLWTPFTRPVSGTLESSRRMFSNGNETIKATIIEPSAKTVHDLRDRFHYVVYDNNGKGIITSTADPLVAPFNDYLENLVAKRYPVSKPDSKNHSSELSRTVRLIVEAVRGVNGATENPSQKSTREEEGGEIIDHYKAVEKDTAHEESVELTQ